MIIVKLDEFAKEIHQNAVNHGWWESERDDEDCIALIHSEWSEALEEYRAGRPLVWHKCPYNGGMCEFQEVHNTGAGIVCDACTAASRKPEGIALELIKMKWDMIIAHPPCTYLTNAGARHLWKGHRLNQERYEKGIEAKAFFMAFLNADCPRIAVENPTPSRVFELPKYTQSIQPYQFGHPYTKRTNLWLKGLQPLQPTDVVEPIATWCPSGSYSGKHGDKHRGMFTTDRARNRSKTFPGIAKAMAEQWAGDA